MVLKLHKTILPYSFVRNLRKVCLYMYMQKITKQSIEQSVREGTIQIQPYYRTKTWLFLSLKALYTKRAKIFTIETFVDRIRSKNLNILGMTFLRRSLCLWHSSSKWYSPLSKLQLVHIRCSNGTLSGLAQRLTSTSSLCDDVLNRVNECLSKSDSNTSKYGL